MKLTQLLIIMVIISLFIIFCGEDDPFGLKIPENAYKYTGYDTTGVKIVTGWIKLEFQDSINVTGEWSLSKVNNPKNIGPQIGSGELWGIYDTTWISIDLQPQMRDNNVILNGEMCANRISGSWFYVGFAGVLNHGPFSAIKKE